MGRDDLALMGNAQVVQDGVGMLHGFPVGLGAHDNTDKGIGIGVGHGDFIGGKGGKGNGVGL